MKFIFFSAIIILFSSCSSVKETDNPDPEYFNNSTKVINELNSVEEQGSFFPGVSVEITLYRDLMPSTDPNAKHGLTAKVKLVFADPPETHHMLKATRIWIVKGKSVWETALTQNDNPVYLSPEFSAINGPEWKPNQKVDVVVELAEIDNARLIKVKNILINAVY